MLTCHHCLRWIGSDTPYHTWIETGKCRRCIVAKSENGHECAWCLDEWRIAPKPGESHGICERHAQILTATVVP